MLSDIQISTQHTNYTDFVDSIERGFVLVLLFGDITNYNNILYINVM